MDHGPLWDVKYIKRNVKAMKTKKEKKNVDGRIFLKILAEKGRDTTYWMLEGW